MRLRTAGVGTSTSAPTTRLEPSAVGRSCWVTMPWSAIESCTRTCCCWWGGETAMMRAVVCALFFVCSVAEPGGFLADLVREGGQPEPVDGDDLEGDQAEGGAQRSALEVGVDTEARAPRDRVGEVDLPVGLQPLALIVVEDRVDDLPRVVG